MSYPVTAINLEKHIFVQKVHGRAFFCVKVLDIPLHISDL